MDKPAFCFVTSNVKFPSVRKKKHFVVKKTMLSHSGGLWAVSWEAYGAGRPARVLRAAGVCTFLGGGCDRPLGCLWLAGMLCIYTPSEQKEASGDQAGIPTIPPGFNEGEKKCAFPS